jgi:hypothetical protein
MKFFSLTLLFLLLIVNLCFAQTYEENPSGKDSPVFTLNNNQETDNLEYWELFFTFDVTSANGGSGNYGAEFDGTYFYTTRWSSNLMHKYDINGNLVEEFSIPGVWGIRDLAFDGTYMYGGTRANTIYQMDFNTKTLVGTISSPVPVGFIAYDQPQDAFWCGSWYEGPALVNRNGTQLAIYNTGLQHMSGAALEGSFLYIFDQGQGQGFHQIIYEFDILTGLFTGEFIDVTEDFPGTNGIAGGLFSPENIGYGPAAIGGLLQNDPDILFAYSNHWYIPPYFENFDNFIAGQQTACQEPLYWSTWNMMPCDAVTDPLISENQSWSNPNSVVIVENNDLVQLHQPLTYGIWNVSFMFYIPSGKAGEFGLMSQFSSGEKIYGMQCYLNQGGTGKLFIGDTINFTWTENSWQLVKLLIDIEDDQAEMNIGSNTIASWQWSRGSTIPCKLDVTYFRGDEYHEMYIDDYHFEDYVPVELISFLTNVIDGSVVLEWRTATETNNMGFEIERSQKSIIQSERDWKRVGFVEGNGTTTEIQSYLFKDCPEQGKYLYRLKQIDYDGTFEYSPETEADVIAPLIFSLEQNYPNPFNPSTKIKYSVPQSSQVQVKVFDVLGNEIETLVNEEKKSGSYEIIFNASELPTGVYFYQLIAGSFIESKKMILMK